MSDINTRKSNADHALASASQFDDTSPPRQPGTPFFNLQIAFSPNATLIGQYMTDPFDILGGGVMMITSDKSGAGVYYQSTNWTSPQHPLGGSVLVHPHNGSYAPGNQIAGGAHEVQKYSYQLPLDAAIAEDSDYQWSQFQEDVELDFRIDKITHQVHFNQAPGLKDWDKVSICWHYNGAVSESRVIVGPEHYEDAGYGCSPVEFIWTLVEW